MEIELDEIRNFIGEIPPFDALPPEVVASLTQKITESYVRVGEQVGEDETQKQQLYIVRKGLLSLKNGSGQLMGKLAEGDVCTQFCAGGEENHYRLQTEEDALLYSIPCTELTAVVSTYPKIMLSFLQNSAEQRLNSAVSLMQKDNNATSSLMYTSVTDIMASPVRTMDESATITTAAREMTENGISCIVLSDSAGDITGIITIKDIAKRCVAAGIAPDNPVSEIMTRDMLTIDHDAFAYDALMTMTREGIRHLPVMRDDKLVGVITSGDLIRQEGRNSAYLTGAIKKAASLESLVASSSAVPQLQLQLVNMGATADHVGKGVTAITSAITRRLIELAQDKLGPPPVPFAWVAAGSQARREQTSHSDQDNGIIIDNSVSDKDWPYFQALAKFVSDGLAACGYIYCPGNVMATNPKWCQTQKVWDGYFQDWMSRPEPKALMLSSIFFDLRTIYGTGQLLDEIRDNMLQTSQRSSLFLAHLTSNALKLRPPLGIIRDFVLINDGEHNDTLDLKHNGLAPVVDLARIYALAEGIKPVNTTERIKAVSGSKTLSAEGGANLLDAFEFIGSLRIQHQARQIRLGEKTDNYLPPKNLSRLEREHLKDAFKVIREMQNSIERSFRAGGIG
ncbi:putative nucleotidyltransferase substrate binding domain-containing protein [Granulosicoccaceae sp. 1_MG-2023]|nr:putative nucleotidyltransferase substrate binding domain-containing protein [Granulosicoccaceae sp. 1_MG-2023]